MAKYLSEDRIVKNIVYNSLINIPNRIRPFSWGIDFHRSDNLSVDGDGEIPNMIIFGGRRLAGLAIYLKHLMEKRNLESDNPPRVKLVSILNPEYSFKHFDWVILPSHDMAKKSYQNNVVEIVGSLCGKMENGEKNSHRSRNNSRRDDENGKDNGGNSSSGNSNSNKNTSVNDVSASGFGADNDTIDEDYWNSLLSSYRKPFFTWIIGGDTKYGKMNPKNLGLITKKISDFVDGENGTLLVTSSRRTSYACLREVEKNIFCSNCLYDYNNNYKIANPYNTFLEKSDMVFITGDSISMISEAATIGKPIYIYCPEESLGKKHHRFCDSMIVRGNAKELNIDDTEGIRNFMVDPSKRLNELERVGNKILKGE